MLARQRARDHPQEGDYTLREGTNEKGYLSRAKDCSILSCFQFPQAQNRRQLATCNSITRTYPEGIGITPWVVLSGNMTSPNNNSSDTTHKMTAKHS